MTDMMDVKRKIREILLADSAIKEIVEDRIYIDWIERQFRHACITIFDPSEHGEPAMLGGTQDQYVGTVQVDVWSRRDPMERDRLAEAVKAALGRKANFQSMQASGFILGSPEVRTLDEIDVKPPIYRKSLRFTVLYWTESYE
ncbi:MAG: hypothetical protein DRN88_03830 [Candidatus Hydrothermarchaeota archaeon]|nr:MAG: hypothetical protein DRN88_03830 [Candidatus Hydrothermarchaeota archaeon]